MDEERGRRQMIHVNCEDFERDFDRISDSGADAERRQALQNHRQVCPHCRHLSAETLRLRGALLSLPTLELSPQFEYRLRRAVRELESGAPRVQGVEGLQPYPLTLLSAGFVTALLLGFLFLRPSDQPAYVVVPGQVSNTATSAQTEGSGTQTALQKQALPLSAAPLFAEQEGIVDTARHRLPEAPGRDVIPIPVEDDLWRINQASTTPASP